MSQRELTDGEFRGLNAAILRLARERKKLELKPAWFVADSALALATVLDQEEHAIDAAIVAMTAELMVAGRSEELLGAIKRLSGAKRDVTLVPMDARCGAILN